MHPRNERIAGWLAFAFGVVGLVAIVLICLCIFGEFSNQTKEMLDYALIACFGVFLLLGFVFMCVVDFSDKSQRMHYVV